MGENPCGTRKLVAQCRQPKPGDQYPHITIGWPSSGPRCHRQMAPRGSFPSSTRFGQWQLPSLSTSAQQGLGFYESHSFSFPVSEATTSVLAHPYVFSSVPHSRRDQMRGKYRPCFKESQPGDEVSHSSQPVGRVGAKGP